MIIYSDYFAFDNENVVLSPSINRSVVRSQVTVNELQLISDLIHFPYNHLSETVLFRLTCRHRAQ